jgi:FkbM family methyltransferase
MRRRLINYWLKKKKLTVAPLNGPTFGAALDRLKTREIPISTIIDVGASTGSWSELVLPCYPKSRYLLIEAQPAHEPALKEFVARHRNAEYVLAAAGDREGETHFDASLLLGGQASNQPYKKGNVVLPLTTIDRQVEMRRLPPPYLIKLDTHGFEWPIITGAAHTLKQTEVLIIEVYNFDIASTVLRFPELCRRLEMEGFRCVDIFDPLYRPHDNALWQMDMVFIRSNRPEFQYNEYA